MENQQERRRFVRLNALVDVIYKRLPFSEEKEAEEELSLTKNISKGGICLIVYEELKESDILDLEICLPEDKIPINATGRVVWAKKFIIGDPIKGKRFDVGIEFMEIKEEDLNRIDKYIFNFKR